MKNSTIILVIALMIPALLFSQSKRELLKEGNKLYNAKKYNDAEINYRKAAEGDNDSKAMFNLGDALYKEGNYKEAAEKFANIATKKNVSDDVKAQALHNMGNSFLKSGMYDKSIDAYKNSLRLNPDDNDTRYNLEYARRMLQLQQQQKQNNQQNKQDNKDNQDKKNQNGQNQDKDKQDQSKQDQQKNGDKNDRANKDKQGQQKDGQDKDKQDQQKNGSTADKGTPQEQQGKEGEDGKQMKGKISKQDAERILNALMNQEREVQKKVRKQKGSPSKTEKNW